MNSKEHVIRLATLERELRATPDEALAALIETTTADAKKWLAGLAGSAEEDGVDISALRGAMQRGRMKGVPDKVAAILTDPCLQDCIEVLGDKADLPNVDDLQAVTAGLVERHGLHATRLMFASAVLGEAPSSPSIVKVLKNDPSLALAPAGS